MKIVKAFKFRLKTNREIQQQLENFCGSARFVWNKFLALNLARLEAKQKIFWYYEMSHWLTLWKSSAEYSFLKETSAHVLQQKLMDLDRAFKDCFDKNQPVKRMPTWRKRQLHNSFRYPAGFKVENGRVFLPKIGWVKFFSSREIVGKAKNVTISKSGKHWYVSIQTEQEVATPVHSSSAKVGIDLGIASFAGLSSGRQVASPKAFSKAAKRLARQQRLAAKKKRGSKNRAKAKQKVAVLHQRVANVRKDFLHKLSYDICKNHAEIVIEGLKIKNMSKSAKGTTLEPGKNVRAKSGLNRSILDQGWGEFRRQLGYKAFWFGAKLVEVDAKYTSQKCSSCYYVSAQNRKTQEAFLCQSCGHAENADTNAAKNILAAGQAVSVCGEALVGVFSEAETTCAAMQQVL